MASDSFITELRKSNIRPCLRFDHDGDDETDYVISVGEIRRNIDLMPGYCDVVVDNGDGHWNDYLTDDAMLTKKAVVTMGLSGFASYTASTISFHENTPAADTLEDSASQFVIEGYKKGMVISIAGSDDNDQIVTIASVTAGVITLLATDDLVEEVEGDSITLETEELPLFTGYVESADPDWDNRTVTLHLRDRLSLLLERKLQTISLGIIYPVWTNYYNSTGTVKQDPYIISDIIWNILTIYADFDDTASTANTDIDYASWQDWASHADDGGYDLYDIGVVANGESCADVLMKIAQLTESAFYVGGDGRLKFQIVRTPGAWRQYTDEILKVGWSVAMEYRINAISCAWGYRPDCDRWLSDVSGIAYDDSAVGPTDVPYTYSSETEQDRSVFHNTSDSADIYIAAKLARCAAPPREFRITTQALGFVEDVRTDIALQNLYADPYDDIGIQINEITFRPDDWTVDMVGWFIWSF